MLKRKMVKFLCILISIIFLCNTTFVFANLEDDEVINVEEIKEEVIQTSANAKSEPNLNSRVALIYDRASSRILYEKNGNKQTPMASTTNIMTS